MLFNIILESYLRYTYIYIWLLKTNRVNRQNLHFSTSGPLRSNGRTKGGKNDDTSNLENRSKVKKLSKQSLERKCGLSSISCFGDISFFNGCICVRMCAMFFSLHSSFTRENTFLCVLTFFATNRVISGEFLWCVFFILFFVLLYFN